MVEDERGGGKERDGKGTHNPDNLNRRERENTQPRLILKRKSNQQRPRLRNVLSQHVQHELLDVVENPAALLDGGDDGRKVVVREDNV